MRNKLFISHATPADNEFAKWLYVKLTNLGYEVWCDTSTLPKGTDFWQNIEHEIRSNTAKFLIVQSEISNKAPGVLNELAVAVKVKKQLQDDTFIIPLSIDSKLSYDDINIELVRLNAVDFKSSWAEGLRELIVALEKQSVPKLTPDENRSAALYQQIFLEGRKPIEKDERYVSNWFPITDFPQILKFHHIGSYIPVDFDMRSLPFPAIRYKDYVCTFAGAQDFVNLFPGLVSYDSKDSINLSTKDILAEGFQSEVIPDWEARRLIVQLTNKAIEKTIKSKGLNEYELSNKIGYWFKKDQLDKDKFDKVQMVGKQKEKNWHYGISLASKLYPYPVVMVSSHIFFTSDGATLIESDKIQHAARRRQGRNWWNDDWRTKLTAFVKYLSDNETSILLKAGASENIVTANTSMEFNSKISYNIPTNESLTEEAEIDELFGMDDLEDDNQEQNPQLD